MLIDSFKTDCVMLDKTTASDGEGGFTTVWKDGAKFKAAIVRNSTAEVRIAEQEGFTNVYTVTTAPNANLKYGDIFKRVSDGQIFRVTSNGDDLQTPSVSTFKFQQVAAEEWKLT